jgi:inosine-uridine nucleoside N-ribohydrolase
MPVPVILDCDTGTDDAVAIMAAALHPDLRLLGVTTVWGNHDVRHTTDNTLRVLDHIGRGAVPVHAGRNAPFRPRPTALPTGRADLPSTLDLPAARSAARSADAVGWLVETLRAASEPVTLVPTGPLTNLAAAVEVAPDVIGSVVRAGFADLTFIGMDATFAAALDAADSDRLAALGTPAGEAAARFQRERIAQYGGASAPLHDPLALAHVVDASVVGTRPTRCRVDLTPGAEYGRTVYELDAEGPHLRVGLTADAAAFLHFLEDALG